MATASSPDSLDPLGRPHVGAAAARTDELFREHGRMVTGLCRALMRDRAEAEDAAQQAFLSAHRALLNGSVPREPAAWLATIARNECVARVRARMRTPLATDDVEQEGTLADPVDEAIRRADLSALWRAIRQLPGPQREALLLREFGGLTYDELAAALSVSESAVESLLFRARAALRTRLEPVYAALSGASWVEWLGRLFAGGSSVAAPVAAKVVALGVGAAVVTGGAVVGPEMLGHRPHRAVSAAGSGRATTQRPVEGPTSSALLFAPTTQTRPLNRVGGRGEQAPGERVAEPPEQRGGGEGGGEAPTGASTAGSTGGDDGHESGAATPTGGGHDGGQQGGGQDGGRQGGDAPGGEVSGGASGTGGSDGGGDGGSATTTEPTTTEPTTTSEEPATTTTLTAPEPATTVTGEDGGSP